MIDLKIEALQWSPNETSLIVKFAEAPPTAHCAALAAAKLRCYVRVPLTPGETLLHALWRARAMLADTSIVMLRRRRAPN